LVCFESSPCGISQSTYLSFLSPFAHSAKIVGANDTLVCLAALAVAIGEYKELAISAMHDFLGFFFYSTAAKIVFVQAIAIPITTNNILRVKLARI
jgi:hypothetical protein